MFDSERHSLQLWRFFFLFRLAERSEQASNVEWNIQLHYPTISVLREEQERMAELNPTQSKLEWVLHKDSTWRRWRTKGKLLDVRWWCKIRFELSHFKTFLIPFKIHNMTTCSRTETTDVVDEWSDPTELGRTFKRSSVTLTETSLPAAFSLNRLIRLIHRVMTQSKIRTRSELLNLCNYLLTLHSPWMSSSQLATYNSCTSRSGYSYSTPLQQPVQSVSLINNSYSGLPNSISGEMEIKLFRAFSLMQFPSRLLPSISSTKHHLSVASMLVCRAETIWWNLFSYPRNTILQLGSIM